MLLNLSVFGACQTSALSSSKAITAGALCAEYQQSNANARSKYDGKELFVRGYVETAPRAPRPDDDQGSVALKEKEDAAARGVTCWFSREQTTDFSRIKGGEYITVKGVFTGEDGPELKFCKLVKIDDPERAAN